MAVITPIPFMLLNNIYYPAICIDSHYSVFHSQIRQQNADIQNYMTERFTLKIWTSQDVPSTK